MTQQDNITANTNAVAAKSDRLKAQEAQLSSLCAVSPASMLLHDLNGDIVDSNSTVQTLLGYTEAELSKLNMADIQPSQKRDTDQDLGAIDAFNMSQVEVKGAVFVKKGGGRIPVDVKTSFIRFKNKDEYITVIQRVFHGEGKPQFLSNLDLGGLAPDLNDCEGLMQIIEREWRSPLNDMVSTIKAMGLMSPSNEQKDLLATMLTSGERLAGTLRDASDLFKVNTGNLKSNKHPCNIMAIIGDVVELIGPEAEAKGVEFSSFVAADIDEYIVADEARMRNIILKSLRIALSLTEQGSVKLEVNRTRDGRVRFEILDTGEGVDEEAYQQLISDKLMDKMSISRRYSGVVLNYMLARKLVQMMGGIVGFSSLPGVGALFWFSLDVAAEDQEISGIDNKPSENKEFLQGQSIVYIDVIEDARNQLERQLMSWGANLQVFSSEKAAVSFLTGDEIKQLDPSLILLNVHRTDVSHAALMRSVNEYLNSNNNIEKCDFVVITPGNFEPIAAHQFARVRHTHVRQPVRPAVLANKLARLLKFPEPFAAESEIVAPVEDLTDKKYDGRILIADDGKVTQMVVSAILNKVGYRVDCVSTGAEVVHAVEQKHYDLILMDIWMPEMDGIEATARVRALEQYKTHIPIIGITNNISDEVWRRCVHTGMDDYMTKPIEPQIMVATVAYWLGGNEVTTGALDRRSSSASSGRNDSRRTDRVNLKQPDLVTTQVLKQLANDTSVDIAKEMIGLFIEETADAIVSIRQAVESRDPAKIRSHANALIMSCKTLGASGLLNVLNLMAESASHQRGEGCQGLLIELDDVFRRSREEFHAFNSI
ncbi:MAG: hypothetical protein COA99_11380 [Moraxellaceae bacterium]|nr:MAG: hypothetical protein COA99_11380 [Moraxellaceae bacterium]